MDKETAAMKIPALGRPFKLGMLYDVRKDELIPGISLWNDQKIAEVKQTGQMEMSSDVEIILEDRIDDKATALDIKGSLKLSCLGGLVDVSGSAAYLDNRMSSNKKARVTLKYSATTSFQELGMELLGSGNYQHRDAFTHDIATHVVTGIMYGGQAFFIFDRELSESEHIKDVKGDLQCMVKKLSTIKFDGDVNLKLDEKEKTTVENLTCKFCGDFIPDNNPTTYEDAVNVYRNLPKLMLGEDRKKARAVQVWLYPLRCLDNKTMSMVREISVSLVNQVGEVLDELHNYDVRCNDLVIESVCSYFPRIRKQIIQFQKSVLEFKTTFKMKLTCVLPKIRGRQTEEGELAQILIDRDQSPFARDQITDWLDKKKHEIKVLNTYVNMLQDVDMFACSIAELGSVTADPVNSLVACFTFKLAGQSDNTLDNMAIFLKNSKNADGMSNLPLKLWFEREDIIPKMIRKVRLFCQYLQSNKADNKIKMVAFDKILDTGNSLLGASIVLYKDSATIDEDFELPSAPVSPTVLDITHDNIIITWQPPESGKTNVSEYKCLYKTNDDTRNEWESSNTSETKINITGLHHSTGYLIKVRAISLAGSSPPAEVHYEHGAVVVTHAVPTGNYQGSLAVVSEQDSLGRRMKRKSKQIQSGTPAIYKLPLETIELSESAKTRTCKLDVGDRSSGIYDEKTLMVVGATGAGKSTMIDGMVNYLLDIKLDDDFRFKLIDLTEEEEKKGNQQAQSQTEYITAYKIPHTHGSPVHFNLNIIDTPGFGDCRGIKRDMAITEQIRQLFSAGGANKMVSLDAVCFVVQAPLARLTPTQRYVFDSVLSVFGKDIADNILMMITFADGAKPPVLAAIKAADLPFEKSYKFNNSGLFEDNTDKNDLFQTLFWEMGKRSLTSFFNALMTMPTRSLILTNDVLKERKNLEVTIQGLTPQITQGLSNMETLRQEQAIMKQHEAEMKANQNFTYVVDVEKCSKVDIPVGSYITNCMQCNRTCHPRCALANDSDKQRCAAMSNGSCTVCPGKCHWSKHVNQSFEYKFDTIKETRTYGELKARYEDAQRNQKNKQSMVGFIKGAWKKVRDTVADMMGNVRYSLDRLDQIALRPDPVSDVEYIELLIESEKSEGRPGYVERVKSLTEFKTQAQLVHDAKREGYEPLKGPS